LLLRTAFNSDEVKKALASCVDQRDEFRKLGHKPSNVAPGDDAGDVVCELNVAKSGHGHGVDVIKLLRSARCCTCSAPGWLDIITATIQRLFQPHRFTSLRRDRESASLHK